MKKIILISSIIAIVVTTAIFAGNAIIKNDKTKTSKELCSDNGCKDKGDGDTTKCMHSGACKMQCNKSEGTSKTCTSKCQDKSKCMNGSAKCDSSKCKGDMSKCKTMNNCPMKKK